MAHDMAVHCLRLPLGLLVLIHHLREFFAPSYPSFDPALEDEALHLRVALRVNVVLEPASGPSATATGGA